MRVLKHILEKHSIKDNKSFEKFLNSKVSKMSISEFTLLDSKALDLDDENRLHDQIIKYEKTIFDVEEIRLRTSSKIEFKDCIILGDLNVSENNVNQFTKINIDSCIITGSFSINFKSNQTNNDKIYITNLNCNQLIIHNTKLQDFSISFSHVFEFSLTDCTIDNFFTFGNFFDYFEFRKSEIKDISFDYKQVNENNLSDLLDYKKIDCKRKQFNPFDYTIAQEIPQNEKENTINDTFDFLANKTNAKNNREKFSDLLKLKTSATQNWFDRKLLKLLDFFLKPVTIILSALIVLLISTIFYRLGGLNLMQAAYLSGITFTTIGYGDIAPTGLLKIVAVIEGFLGIFLTSGFLVSLLRRYSDSLD